MNLKKSNICPICNGSMVELVALPDFPYTEKYEPYVEAYKPTGFQDQQFLYCQPCAHGKLGTVIPPSMLYGDGYKTQTSKSIGASHSVNSFFAFIERHVEFGNFDVVIDIGGNDCSLLDKFPEKDRVAVDPNASGSAQLIREYVETADLQPFKADKKLIVSSHTLEHLENPAAFLEKISSILCYGDTVAMQFPSLDYLVRDARCDQIHHQHIHYFSLRSTSLLFARHGLEIVQADFDEGHYGTLRLIARRGAEELKGSPITEYEIKDAWSDFLTGMDGFNASVGRLRQPVAYGASLMLPVLRYYAMNLDRVTGIAEEDESKHGLRYINWNKRIHKPEAIEGKSFVVTAFNTRLAVRKIANKLTSQGAAAVVVPFHNL